jgi:4-carboxymuconolactone decarboxylase
MSSKPTAARQSFGAIENGVTHDELVELITHLAFYAGWPNAMSTVSKLKELFPASSN